MRLQPITSLSRSLLPWAILPLVAACHTNRSAPVVDTGTPLATATMVVKAEPAPVYATVPGIIVSKRHAQIASRLTGYVRSVSVQVGDHVAAGQALLVIDSSDVTGQLQQAQAAFDEVQTNYQRTSNLYAKGVASKVALDAATRQYATAKAALDMAQAAVGYADVHAPFAGVIVDKFVDAGDLATPGKPLLVLEDEHTLEVQSYVPEEVYGALRTGEDLRFSTDVDDYTGRVQSVVAAADPQTHTHLLRVAIPADAGLSSGRYVRVHIPVNEQPAIRIPQGALTERAGITGVFTVDADGHAQFRLVHTGTAADGMVDIQSGLASGERLVLRPDGQVDNGTLIASSGHEPE